MAKKDSAEQGGQSTPETITGAQSQAQSTSAEAEQRDQAPEQALDGAGRDERQYFDGTIAKINAEGNEVMSDHLAPGERLRRATTEDSAAEQRAERTGDQ